MIFTDTMRRDGGVVERRVERIVARLRTEHVEASLDRATEPYALKEKDEAARDRKCREGTSRCIRRLNVF
jgi:hypothetical protein